MAGSREPLTTSKSRLSASGEDFSTIPQWEANGGQVGKGLGMWRWVVGKILVRGEGLGNGSCN